MPKKYSKKFWITFWLISALFLAGWCIFWQFKNNRTASINSVIDLLPISNATKDEYHAINYLAEYLTQKDDQPKTFLILFQNNMELRPGGGYIGSFGILTLKNGQVVKMETHDLSNFDGRIPDTIEPPYPMKETLRIKSWKLRDSNWSPDFPTNAQKAEEFYRMGQGQEELNGIIAINANTLSSFLKETGPITIEGYPGTYDSENAILSLEYQVEQGYAQQGISRGERKSVMNSLADEITKRVSSFGPKQKLELATVILEDLRVKDIQLYLKDADLETQVERVNWSGELAGNWNGNFLMIVDANMGSLKSDYYIKRSFDYTVDYSQEVPEVKLMVTYNHTAKEKDWMTKDYLAYLRVYVPEGSWYTSGENLGEVRYGTELGKKYFGSLISVPLGQSKTVVFNYALPKELKNSPDKFLIQKQSGISEMPAKVTIINEAGDQKSYETILKSDWTL